MFNVSISINAYPHSAEQAEAVAAMFAKIGAVIAETPQVGFPSTLGASEAAPPVEVAEAPKPKPAARKPKVETSASVVDTPANDPAPAEEPEEIAAEEPQAKAAIVYADVQEAVKRNAVDKGREHIIATLGQFGVDHASKVAEDQWGAFIAALDAEIAA